MNVTDAGLSADETPDPKQVAFEAWLYSGNNQSTAINYMRNHASLVPERIALHPTPRYNRRTRKLTVWLWVLTDKGEKVFDMKAGEHKRVKATVKVSTPPPWVQ